MNYRRIGACPSQLHRTSEHTNSPAIIRGFTTHVTIQGHRKGHEGHLNGKKKFY